MKIMIKKNLLILLLQNYFNVKDGIEKFDKDLDHFNNMFNSTVNDKRICINSKLWWSDDLGDLVKEKNRINNKINKRKKKKNPNYQEIKELKIRYNKIRQEIELEKRKNIELQNEIQAQINLNLGHKKAGKKLKMNLMEKEEIFQLLSKMEIKQQQIKRRQIC